MPVSPQILESAFDHKQWLESLPADAVDCTSPDSTFRYVVRHHPLGGCSFSLPPMSAQDALHLKIEDAAKLTDAVAVCCCEHLGDQAVFGKGYESLPSLAALNETSVGCLAYIAVNHSNARVRKSLSDLYETLKLRFASDSQSTPVPPAAQSSNPCLVS
jgi:hypothetical protein